MPPPRARHLLGLLLGAACPWRRAHRDGLPGMGGRWPEALKKPKEHSIGFVGPSLSASAKERADTDAQPCASVILVPQDASLIRSDVRSGAPESSSTKFRFLKTATEASRIASTFQGRKISAALLFAIRASWKEGLCSSAVLTRDVAVTIWLTEQMSRSFSSIILATVATDPDHPGLHNWRQSASQRGWKNVEVLGMGQKWAGWRVSSSWILDFMRAHPDDLILLTDAYDCLINAPPTEALSLMNGLPPGQNAIFGTETLCYPRNCRKRTDRGNFVSAGVCLGRGEALAQIYETVEKNDDEQLGFYDALDILKDAISEDAGSRMAFNLTPNWYEPESTSYVWWSVFHVIRPDQCLARLRFVDAPVPQLLLAGGPPLAVHVPGSPLDKWHRYMFVAKKLLRANCRAPAGAGQFLWYRHLLVLALVVLAFCALLWACYRVRSSGRGAARCSFSSVLGA